MNKNAQKWVEALESGRFKQGRLGLTKGDKHCCLGVACVVYQEEVGGLNISSEGDKVFYDHNAAILPSKVQKWLGLHDRQGSYGRNDHALTSDNDEGATFSDIAKTIRDAPEGLFAEDSGE